MITKKKLFILYFISIALCITYFLSFIFSFDKINSEYVTSALVNKKNIASINEIEISSKNTKIIFSKKNMWYATDTNIIFPVDNSKVEQFIESLTRVINMYTISHSSNFSDYELEEESATIVSFKINNNMSTKLYFGRHTFDESMRYLRINERKTVYSVDSALDKYLRSDCNFWCDANLIPQNIEKKNITSSNIQKITVKNNLSFEQKNYLPTSKDFEKKANDLLSLRHGEVVSIAEHSTQSEYTYIFECGSALEIVIDIYATTNNNFLLSYSAKNALFDIVNYNYSALISKFTFDKMQSLFN